jgi:hypothetical protein
MVECNSGAVTEPIQLKQIRSVAESGATTMDRTFPATGEPAEVSSPTDQASWSLTLSPTKRVRPHPKSLGWGLTCGAA